MVAVPLNTLEPFDEIADHIFDFLWGDERDVVPTAVDHAYRQVWLLLITGAREPGDRLSDVELAGHFGVSRTPVRQALHLLAQDELVTFDPRRGFRVRAFTVKDVHEMYDVRAVLESLAVRQAAPQLKPEDIEVQLDAIAQMRDRLPERPILPCLQHDFRLHNMLIHGSGNRRLIRVLAGLRSQVSFFQVRDTGYPNRLEMALDAHERMLTALLDDRTYRLRSWSPTTSSKRKQPCSTTCSRSVKTIPETAALVEDGDRPPSGGVADRRKGGRPTRDDRD